MSVKRMLSCISICILLSGCGTQTIPEGEFEVGIFHRAGWNGGDYLNKITWLNKDTGEVEVNYPLNDIYDLPTGAKHYAVVGSGIKEIHHPKDEWNKGCSLYGKSQN